MDIEIIITIIKCIVTVLAGTILGNGAVYLFNHMPGKWFLDYDEELPEENDEDTYQPQRVRSTPWKYLFSMFFVPDQLVILLAVSAVGFIQYHTGWQDMLAGAALGLGIMAVTALLGRALYKREAVGGGDIRLFAALGLVLGTKGILFVYMISALLSGAHMVFLLAVRKIKKNDTIPMVPYIAAAAIIYMVFLWQHIDLIISAFL